VTYRVYEARWEYPWITPGREWAFAYDGDLSVLNARFPSLPHTTFIPQLERIRWEANQRSERGMRAGDLIRVDDGDNVQWWIYKAMPPQGGFAPVGRADHLEIIEEGLTTV